MIIVLLLAAALRLYALPEQPVGLHYDEAANVILSRQIASGTYRPLFIHAYTGKEVLFFYWAAPWLAITGGQAWAIRLAAAMAGILTVALTYRAARELTCGNSHSMDIALLSAAWTAISLAHLILSRYGFRAISQPLMQALTVTLLWRGLRSQNRAWLVAAGVSLGLTGYTYLAARMFPFPLAAALLVYLLRTPRQYRRNTLTKYVWILGSAALAFAPLGVFFLRNPETFFTRINQVASTTWMDALNGLWACVLALAVPGRGDAYVRFNVPGVPLLGVFSAIMALLGLGTLIVRKAQSREGAMAKGFLLTTIPVMLLPSALATGEITPSHLRMVGLFPFLLLLPAIGLSTLIDWYAHRAGWRWMRDVALAVVLIAGGIRTAMQYQEWATSTDLFYASDGEMTLAAAALDELAEQSDTTIYIASEHHQHPTVAALAEHYADAKWLTGGASLVLPARGDAIYLVPASVQPPVPWDRGITSRWQADTYADPDGHTALTAYHLNAADIAALRGQSISADFAHTVGVIGATPLIDCYAGSACPVSLTWQVLAPAATLQPVVRLVHPLSGEWARTAPFHYPADQWSMGDIVLDQFVLDLPAGIPAGDQYQLVAGVFNPDTGTALPRLIDEEFAGLGIIIPSAVRIHPAQQATSPALCPDALDAPVNVDTLMLWGATELGETTLRPGERVYVRLCWQTGAVSPQPKRVRWVLNGANSVVLYDQEVLSTVSEWIPERIVEDRYGLRIPRDAPTGQYTLSLFVNDQPVLDVGRITITEVIRDFVEPQPQIPLDVDFGGRVRLLGLDIDADQSGVMTLYWQSLQEVDQDYVVFVHAVDRESGGILAQVDAMPAQNTYSTSLWTTGEIVKDEIRLELNDTLQQLDYVLRIGLYIPDSGNYLLVNGERAITVAVSQ